MLNTQIFLHIPTNKINKKINPSFIKSVNFSLTVTFFDSAVGSGDWVEYCVENDSAHAAQVISGREWIGAGLVAPHFGHFQVLIYYQYG